MNDPIEEIIEFTKDILSIYEKSSKTTKEHDKIRELMYMVINDREYATAFAGYLSILLICKPAQLDEIAFKVMIGIKEKL